MTSIPETQIMSRITLNSMSCQSNLILLNCTKFLLINIELYKEN